MMITPLQESFLDEGFILDKKIGVGQPKRLENVNILVANTAMDTDKIKIYGARVRVDSMQKARQLCAKPILCTYICILGQILRFMYSCVGSVQLLDNSTPDASQSDDGLRYRVAANSCKQPSTLCAAPAMLAGQSVTVLSMS